MVPNGQHSRRAFFEIDKIEGPTNTAQAATELLEDLLDETALDCRPHFLLTFP